MQGLVGCGKQFGSYSVGNRKTVESFKQGVCVYACCGGGDMV